MLLFLRVQDVIRSAGYPGLFALIVAENVFPPIPSEVILPFAGFQVQQGALLFVGALAAATAGSVVGALVLYAIARRGGRQVIVRFGRVLRVDDQALDRIEWQFERHGTAIVLAGRLVPGLRSLVSLPAGLVAMPVVKFVALTAVGSLLWNAALIGGGWLLGAQYGRIADAVGPASTVITPVLLAAVAVGFLLWRRHRTSQ